MGTVIRRGSRPLRAGLVLGLLAALVGGCNLFKPAIPEVGGVVATLLPRYDLPESCLHYMQIGIERKDNIGRQAYLGALADPTTDGMGFLAVHDEEVLRDYEVASGGSPPEWDLSHEAQFLSRFVQSFSDPYRMEWLEDIDYPIHNEYVAGDSAIKHRHYKVWALRPNTGDSLLIAVGYATMSFYHISASRWALVRWVDRVDDSVKVHPVDEDQRTFSYRRLNAR
jgi:hypothetical protein